MRSRKCVKSGKSRKGENELHFDCAMTSNIFHLHKFVLFVRPTSTIKSQTEGVLVVVTDHRYDSTALLATMLIMLYASSHEGTLRS